ncbi:FAD-binding oxidoreductase [Halobacillus massiliensis]|uniref:FAD-binding oxidoreductase n=1 Tax=Halobacillus massiliensis TaxID=1926286 RepID=UPI0009E53A23|nr:FAD-binding oxidoreductase [Halobacillus massiliensis]
METKDVLQSTINGFGNNGTLKYFPVSESEISEILKKANQAGDKVTVVSGGTKRGYGGLKNDYDIVLSLADYKGIVEHTAGDMTVTVRSGTTIQELQDFLKDFGQMVSLDPNWPADATIGGVIAANESGPKRMKYGSARDQVIGLRIVYPDGTLTRTGGKVVKNVAGYDMNKLFIGSMGTLGVITEITMKLRPVPKCESLIQIKVPSGKLDDLRAFSKSIQDSMLEPVTLEIMNPAFSKRILNEESFHLLIGLEDVENSVRYQETWIEANIPEGLPIKIVNGEEACAFWSSFSNAVPNSLSAKQNQAVLKISTKNMDVFEIIHEAQKLEDEGLEHVESHGGTGHGISYVILTGNKDGVTAAIKKLRAEAEKRKGHAVIKHMPYEWRKETDVWGHNPAYFFLLQGIKEKADPNNTLNHQRFVGGI